MHDVNEEEEGKEEAVHDLGGLHYLVVLPALS